MCSHQINFKVLRPGLPAHKPNMKMIVEEDLVRSENHDEAGRAIDALRDLCTSTGTGFRAGKDLPRGGTENESSAMIQEGCYRVNDFKYTVRASADALHQPALICDCEGSRLSFLQPVRRMTEPTFKNGSVRETELVPKPSKSSPPPSSPVTSDNLVSNMISQRRADHGVDLMKPVTPDTEALISSSERRAFSAVLTDLSSPSPADRKQAVKSLRQLTKRSRSFRTLVGDEPTAIHQLLSILSDAGDDHELREEAVTAVFNLSIHDANKKTIGESNGVALLIQSMKTGGTMNTLSNAAAALFTLSALDSNKSKIGELGAIPPLVDLFDTGSLAAKKDAASAIFNLCLLNENKARAVRAGAVNACIAAIEDSSSEIMDESLTLLALLSTNQEAAEEVADAGGVPPLLMILRTGASTTNLENAVVVLYAACSSARSTLKEVGEEESIHGTISKLSTGGTSRAMRKAAGILEKLKRIKHNSHWRTTRVSD